MPQSLIRVLDTSSPAGDGAGATALLAGILESAMDAIITVDADQNIVMFNKAAEQVFGFVREQLLGQPLARLIPDRFHAAHQQHVGRFSATGTTSRRMGRGLVILGRRANGEEFPMEASISQLNGPTARLFTVILRDVSERLRMQEERDAYAVAAVSIREEEKSRVARELHDELAQPLTALKMDALWMRENLASAPEATAARLGEMLSMLEQAVASTRRIAADLRPSLLDDLGLVPAIHWLAENFNRRHGIECVVVADEEVEPGEPHASSVFRIVQEALVNVAKHAGASRVDVSLQKAEGGIALVVQDNGCGFDNGSPRKSQSLGLMGLRERVDLLKGRYDLRSVAGQGTVIAAWLPLHAAR